MHRFLSSCSSIPAPPPPRPVPASLRVPWAADGIAPRRDRTTPARLPSTGVDDARSGSAGDGAGGVWGVGSPGCRLPSVDGRGRVRALHDEGVAGRQGPARRRERARATWRGRRALQAPGPDARFPARVKGRRRGARKRSAPCRTRRRRGRRRGPCVRDRRAGRTGPAPPTGPGAGAKSTGSLVQRDMSLKGVLNPTRSEPVARGRITRRYRDDDVMPPAT